MLNSVSGRGSTSWIAVLVISTVAFLSTGANAASINYGNFPAGPGVTFIAVTESSGTDTIPLFGPPDPFLIGLDFDPTSFVSSANNGGADITDGQLNSTIQGLVVDSNNHVAINTINIFESGDFTLAGTGTSTTQVTAAASISAKITEVDGVTLANPVTTFANASVTFNLAANPGAVQPWSIGLSIDLNAFLSSESVPYSNGATRVEIAVDDTLLSISQPSTIAHITKKEFVIDLETSTEGVIPEPGTAALAMVVLSGLTLRRKRSI